MLENDTYLPHRALDKPPQFLWLEWLEKAIVIVCAIAFSNFFIFILVGKSSDASADPGPLARASWFPFYLLLLIGLSLKWKAFLVSLPRLWLVLSLFGLTVLSITWSMDPSLTQRRVIALFFTVLFGVYVAVRAPYLDTLRLLGRAWIIIALVALAIVFVAPSIGKHWELHVGAWRGFFGEKNHYGGEMARANILFCALLFLDKDHRKLWWFGFAITFLSVLGSTSKTALLSMLIPYACYAAYYMWSRSNLMGLFTVWAGASVLGVGYFILTGFPEQIVELIGKDLTFTGRTDIWALCVEYISERPWTGFGYAAFWTVEDGPAYHIQNILDWDVPTAHNGWIEIGLSIGFPGIYTTVALVLYALIKSIWLATGKHGPVPFIFMLQLLLFSLSESLLLVQNTYATGLFIFYLSYVMVARRVPNETEQTSRRPEGLTPRPLRKILT